MANNDLTLPATDKTLNTLLEIDQLDLAELADRIRTGPTSFVARVFQITAVLKGALPVIESATKARLEADPTPIPLTGGKSLVMTTTNGRKIADMEALIDALRAREPEIALRVVKVEESTTIGDIEKAMRDRAPGFLAGLSPDVVAPTVSRSLKVIG